MVSKISSKGEPTIWFGLSTDTKPTSEDAGNADIFMEIDTSTVYFYDADGDSWEEWSA